MATTPGDDVSFLSLDNLKQCEARFRTYMRTRHHMTFDGESETVQLKQLLYGVMNEVRARSAGDSSLRALNNATLNGALEAVMAMNKGGKQHQQKTAAAAAAPASHLQRDRDLYGSREVNIGELGPPGVRPPSVAGEVDRAFEKVERERGLKHAPAPPSWADVSRPTVTVSAMDSSEFENRLSELENLRKSDVVPGPPVPKPANQPPFHMLGSAPDDSLVIARRVQQDADAFRAEHQTASASAMGSTRAELLTPPPQMAAEPQVRYLTLCGGDRDLTAFPNRYQFAARTGGNQGQSTLHGSYPNVAWIEATRVMLPMEAMQATGAIATTKGFYNLECSFAFQYLVLSIRGLEGSCDGTNELIRHALCTLVYDRDYKAPNGRGYVLLKPAQDERKVYTTPLATLPELVMTLAKPNGTLFNNSMDAYTVATVQYEPQNRLYLKIVLDQYFDRNEYWVGDYVRMSGLSLESVTDGATQPPSAAYVGSLERYINREQGFEIVQLGASNDQGFHKSFYVLAPGVLDQANGAVIIDANLIEVVQALGASSGDPSATVRVAQSAKLLNMSLQAVVTMRVGCLVGAIPAGGFGAGGPLTIYN